MKELPKTELLDLLTKVDKVKQEIGKVVKDSENPFFESSYTDVNSLLEQLEPILKKEGLVLIQPLKKNRVYSEVYDIKTGASLSSSLELPENPDPQKIGSAITYYRRYTLTSLFALQSEEDDDGNVVSGKTEPKKMVTMKQGKYLQSLGMEEEEIRKLTSKEAYEKIKELTE